MKYIVATLAALTLMGLFMGMPSDPVIMADDQDEVQFLDFVVDYARNYKTSEEMRFRYNQFKSNLVRLKEV